MAEAAAQNSAKRISQVLLSRMRLLVKDCFDGEDDSAQAKTALNRTLIDEALLDRVSLLRSTESLQRYDLAFAHSADVHHAGACDFAVDQHAARPALRHA